MPTSAIVLPACALVALTFVTWIRLYRERIGEIRRRRMDPQRLATRRGAAEALQDTRAADHFRNLLEVPVLFYAFCALLAATDAVTPLLVGLAWLFVGLRVVQAGVHLTCNRMLHRFRIYVAGTAVQFVMWAPFLVQTLAA